MLWADDVHLTAARPLPATGSTPTRSARVAPGPLPSSYLDPSGCRGQHRCYVDGSVEWVSGAELGLDASSKKADVTATYRLWAGYWWF